MFHDSVCPRARVLCVQQAVPEGEERLGEVGLDAPVLVVDVVIGCVVASDELQRIPGERVAAVVIDSLDGRQGEKPYALAHRHESRLEGETCTNSIEKEALKGVVVQGAICVGNVESVVSRVKGS